MNKAWALLRLASPQLPIGGYSYSQGLEWAIDSGLVKDAESAERDHERRTPPARQRPWTPPGCATASTRWTAPRKSG